MIASLRAMLSNHTTSSRSKQFFARRVTASGRWYYFRRMKQTGLEVRPMFHWTARRIEAHVRLCVLALQMQSAAEIRCSLPWSRIAHELAALKAVRYQAGDWTIVQRSKITDSLGQILKKLGISIPKQILTVSEPVETAAET